MEDTQKTGTQRSSGERPNARAGRAKWLPRSIGMLTAAVVLAVAGYGVWMGRETRRDLDRLTLRLERVVAELADLDDSLADLQAEATQIARRLPVDVPALVNRVNDSIVTVEVLGGGQGSGFVLETEAIPSGYGSAIVTAYHVIDVAVRRSRVPILIYQGPRSMRAELGGWDRRNDLAVLFIESELPALAWSAEPTEEPAIGDIAISVGSPFGLQGSATVGVISKVLARLIQTDAAVNPGASGGPLLNGLGDVIGVNSFALSRAENLNFAVRIERICDRALDC